MNGITIPQKVPLLKIPLKFRWLSAAPGWFAITVFFISVFVLVGWTFEVDFLKRIIPGYVFMNPTTAVAFILSSIALWLLQSAHSNRIRLAQGCAAAVLLIGLIKLCAIMGFFDWSIDQICFRDRLFDYVTGQPNRMAPNTALNFLLLGAALLLLNFKPKRGDFFPAQYPAIVVVLTSFLAVIGYLYGAKSFYVVVSFNPMAIHTAVSFLLLAGGLLLSKPGHGLVKEILSPHIGGQTARRLFPLVVIIPMVLGWLRLYGEKQGLYADELGTAMLVIAIVVIFGSIVIYHARLTNNTAVKLRQTEDALTSSDELLTLLSESEAEFKALVKASSQIVWGADKNGQDAKTRIAWEELTGQKLIGSGGWNWLDSLHSDDRKPTQRSWQDAFDTKTVYEGEFRILVKTGGYRWFLMRGVPIVNDHGVLQKWVGMLSDITERKQAEETLRRREGELSDFLENSTVGLHWTEADGKIIWANKAELDLLGYTREEYFGRNISEFHDDQDTIADILKRENNNEILHNYEARLRSKDGAIKHVLINSNVFWDDGKFVRTHCFTRDITERKGAEEALRQSEASYRQLADAMPQIVWTGQPDGFLDYYNQRWFDYTGMTLEQTKGWGWGAVLHPDDLQKCIDAWSEAFRTGEEYKIEYRFKRASDGEYRWHLGQALPARNAENQILKWFGTCTDIHDQKNVEEKLRYIQENLELRVEARTIALERANDDLKEQIIVRERVEQALSESTKRERAMIENSLDVICTIDATGHFISINPACFRMWGYQPEELIGRPFINFVAPEDAAKTFEENASIVSGDKTTNFDNRYLHKNGTLVDVRWTAYWSESEKLVFCVAHDITESKQAEEELKDFAAKLERSNAELQDFASVASHDLQEPLRKVQAFGDRLKAKCGDALNDEGRDYLERMQNAAGRMQILINDLLTFSRVATKARPFTIVNLRGVANEVLSDLETLISTSNGRVEIGELPTIEADPTQMRQLLQNLIGNALKFHRPDVPPIVKISGQICHNHAPKNDETDASASYCLTVEDNGIGFDNKYVDRIFKVFQRLHGRSEYEGTGIGLAVCRKIVERHGGGITAQSVPGAGTTFIVDLPVKQQEKIK